ncbi:HNH endonuclease [Vulgatibacter sp.]|uniref:HNH endonuclease n=1 Tax=Vulgatibacter sp. TaxID=1971226 RepID=UPI00356B002A
MAADGSTDGVLPAPVTSDTTESQTSTGVGEREGDEAAEKRALRAVVERLEREVARFAAIESTAIYQQLILVREFDEKRGWKVTTHTSTAAWLAWRIGLSVIVARERVRVARALGRLPQMAEALRKGTISYTKVRALTRLATPENEAELLTLAATQSAHEVERRSRKHRRTALEVIEGRTELARRETRYFRIVDAENGMVRVEGQFHADEGADLLLAMRLSWLVHRSEGSARERELAAACAAGLAAGKHRADGAAAGSVAEVVAAGLRGTPVEEGEVDALAHALTAPEPEEEQLSTFNRADALLAIAAAFLQRPSVPVEGETTHEVIVQVPAESLAGRSDEPGLLADGTPLGLDTVRRLCCDAAVIPVAVDAEGNALDIGRRSRVIPKSMRRALVMRDGRCRFPGCTHDAWLKAHHAQHWSQGGETKVDNLVLLCGHHHWWVHEGGCSVRREDGRFRFYDPRGQLIEEAPPLLPNGDASEELMAWLLEHGGGEGIALPIPARHATRAEWSLWHCAVSRATYGPNVLLGDPGQVEPRMPDPDGHPPRGRRTPEAGPS